MDIFGLIDPVDLIDIFIGVAQTRTLIHMSIRSIRSIGSQCLQGQSGLHTHAQPVRVRHKH